MRILWLCPLLAVIFTMGAGAQPLSCGQTNECLSIIADVRLEFLPFPGTQQPARIKERQQRFEILTDGLNWKVVLLDPEKVSDSPVSRREYGCDGENVYEVVSYDTDYAGPRVAIENGVMVTNVGGRRPLNNGSAKVLPGRIPMRQELIGFVWLAYLSGCQLNELERESVFELPALYSVPDEAQHLALREPARWVLSRHFPFTPARLVFFGGGVYGYSKDVGSVRRPPSQPMTNFALVVESTTNSGAWTVPARFSLAIFGPSSGTKGAWLSSQGIGQTISIARVSRPDSFRPAIRSSTHVVDWRFDPEPRTYYTSNRWLTVKEAKTRERR